jgi:predicted RND superfamily exporter protein
MVGDITVKTLVITLISMAAVCVFFIPNVAALLVAVAAIASICTGVMGLLSWWGAYLDPVTMSDLIMAIGFSVDYTTHISYHFYATGTGMRTTKRRTRSYQRMHDTLAHVLYPMLQVRVFTCVRANPCVYRRARRRRFACCRK